MRAALCGTSRSPARIASDIALVGRHLIVALVPAACGGRGEAPARFRTRQRHAGNGHRLGLLRSPSSTALRACPDADRLRTRRMSIEHFAVAGPAFVGDRCARGRRTRAAGYAMGTFRRMLARRMAIHRRRCRRGRGGQFDALLLLRLRTGGVLIRHMPFGIAAAMDRRGLRARRRAPGSARQPHRRRTEPPGPDPCHLPSPVDRLPSSPRTRTVTSGESHASA